MSARLAALVVAALLPTLASPLHAQSGARYTVAMSDGKGRPSTAIVTVLGDRSRIEPLRSGEDTDRSGTSYMIIRDGRLYSIDPDKRETSESSPEEFEQIVGTALRSVSPMVKMHVDDTEITSEELPDGAKVLGYPTRHFRLTQRFNVRVSAFGMSGDDDATANEVITDFWVASDARLPRNPLIEMLIATPTAPAQQSKAFVRESSRVRDALFTGMPLRATVRVRENGEGSAMEKVRVEVTQLDRVRVDTAAFSVPSGYKRNSGRGMRFSL